MIISEISGRRKTKLITKDKMKQEKKIYVCPSCEVLEVEPQEMLAMSGQGTDTNNDYDFGSRGANERRGVWGDRWE